MDWKSIKEPSAEAKKQAKIIAGTFALICLGLATILVMEA